MLQDGEEDGLLVALLLGGRQLSQATIVEFLAEIGSHDLRGEGECSKS